MEFKQVVEHPNYEVSIDGTVRNRTSGKILSQYLNDRGYYMVTLQENYKSRPCRVHRLIALGYMPNPENKPHINHKDGVKTNNNLDNLEWCTNPENISHAFRTGLYNNTGSHNGMAKLTDEKVREIKVLLNSGMVQHKIADIYGVSRSCILSIKLNSRWKHVQ